MPETPEAKKRRLAKERKQRQRQREAEHKKKVGAREFRFELYRGTADALQRIKTIGEFEEEAEVLTLLIHGAARLAERDPSQFKELISVTEIKPCN